MKSICYILLILPFLSIAQGKKLTPEKAADYIDAVTTTTFDVLTISERDSRFSLFRGKEVGAVVFSGRDIYRILEIEKLLIYSFGEILVDVARLSADEKDSLQKEIILKYKGGASFVSLLKKYDANKDIKNAAITAAKGTLGSSFEEELKQHKPGEIFIIDDQEGHFMVVVINKAPFEEKAAIVKHVVYKKNPLPAAGE